jgi:hypothetical protein
MDDTTVEQKPSRAVAFYAPIVLGVITGLVTVPACDCAWPKLILVKAIGVVAGMVFWWIVIMAGFHGSRFVKSFFVIHDEATRHI